MARRIARGDSTFKGTFRDPFPEQVRRFPHRSADLDGGRSHELRKGIDYVPGRRHRPSEADCQ